MTTLAELVESSWHYFVFTGLVVLFVLVAFLLRSLSLAGIPVGYLGLTSAVALLGFVIYCDIWWHYPLDWLAWKIEWFLWYILHNFVELIP